MFKQRQKLSIPCFSAGKVEKTDVLDDGTVVTSFEDVCQDLPIPDNFRLKHLLKAGVPIEQVNSLVIDNGSVDLDSLLSSSSKSSSESSTSKPSVVDDSKSSSDINQTQTSKE